MSSLSLPLSLSLSHTHLHTHTSYTHHTRTHNTSHTHLTQTGTHTQHSMTQIGTQMHTLIRLTTCTCTLHTLLHTHTQHFTHWPHTKPHNTNTHLHKPARTAQHDTNRHTNAHADTAHHAAQRTHNTLHTHTHTHKHSTSHTALHTHSRVCRRFKFVRNTKYFMTSQRTPTWMTAYQIPMILRGPELTKNSSSVWFPETETLRNLMAHALHSSYGGVYEGSYVKQILIQVNFTFLVCRSSSTYKQQNQVSRLQLQPMHIKWKFAVDLPK